MTNQKLKFEDFEQEKLSKNEQKSVHGGSDPSGPGDKDPIKGGGGTVG